MEERDYRSRKERSLYPELEITKWYQNVLEAATKDPNNQRLMGQLTALSAVLWLLLPEKEYKKLTTAKKGLNKVSKKKLEANYQEELGLHLRAIVK